ncbi:MAG TPA: selenocysteine-specific translation elongation factor [Tepidiformaceae bacterium]|nr:selenocysteine-specific translation elongation factor [Tepidiformaceae bacterium]
MYVIGTAGHVDHGKSTLVRALTGIDPDRLREEKERGLTIDLGFAWLTLPSGREVSIVDVPGHERFIKNMLAGAGGVDLALLVVAADEGVMPQTREHLAILDLLDVPGGIVVLTKCDLVEPDYLELVEADVSETVARSRLADAPMVRTAAATGHGIHDLKALLDNVLDGAQRKRDLGRPRLPIDRSFTIQGFGTVVTGTLLDGSLEVGQEVELQPGRLRGRIRGLQRHRTKVQRLEPGTRAAVNVSGIHAEEIERGMVLVQPGKIAPVRAVDVRLTAPQILSHPLAHDAGVTFLSATAESEAKLRLLDHEELVPGGQAWAQVVLESPVAVLPGDHCVVRTPNETAAGGVIVAVNPRRHRRHHGPVIESLERQLAGSPLERLVDLLATGPLEPRDVAGRLGLERPDAEAAISEAIERQLATMLGGRVVSAAWLEAAVGRVTGATVDYLAANPLRSAAPREHIRALSTLDATVFDALLAYAGEMSVLQGRGAGLAPVGYEVTLSAKDQAEVARVLQSLRAGGHSPPTENLPRPELLGYLAERGLVVDTGAGVVFDAQVHAEMIRGVTTHITAKGSITLAEVRDLFGTSRKYAQALLEHMDSEKLTRRVGDTRVLRSMGDRRA